MEDTENYGIEIPFSEEFLELAKETNNYLETLPINQEQMDKLVSYMVQNVEKAKLGGYAVGFSHGAKIAPMELKEIPKSS
ncbi:hypothetical protein [Thomasclavelia cocleata]|uniref:hypothetical protein n=1 Tax=Thomasclavelia cocleata TaxID=69824 RepID=UPI0024308E7C|nr:hypothetical protein [Thomasclavelia cocleata]